MRANSREHFFGRSNGEADPLALGHRRYLPRLRTNHLGKQYSTPMAFLV